MTREQLEKAYECDSAYIGDWNGFRVYELDLSGCIGNPVFLLEKDGSFRDTTWQEGLEVLNWQVDNNIKNPFYDGQAEFALADGGMLPADMQN